MNGLIAWLKGFKTPLQHVFVVHGEDTVTEEFAQKVEETFGCPAWAHHSRTGDRSGCEWDLKRRCADYRERQRSHPRRSRRCIWASIMAGRRLLDVIYKREGIRIKTKQNLKVRSIILLINGIVGNSEEDHGWEKSHPWFLVKGFDL